MKKNPEALQSLREQLDQMSEFCDELEKVLQNNDGCMENIDADTLVKLEAKYLCHKKKLLNATNGLNADFINTLRKSAVKVQ